MAQMTPETVASLKVAWQYNAGEVDVDLPAPGLDSTPLVVGDTMYLSTPKNAVIALDPGTREER